MALGNNPSQTDVIKAIRDLESGSGGSGVQSVTTGTTNGTLSVDGTDVAVYGLGSNAFNSTTIPSTTGSVISGSTSALTSGGAYNSLVNKLYSTTQTVAIFNNTSESTPLKLKSGNAYAYIGFTDANGTDKGALGVDNNGNPVFNDGSDHKLAYASNIPSAGTTASAVDTTGSGGSASTYSKSDHVHKITSSTITSALGYIPFGTTTYTGSTGYGSISSSESTVATFSADNNKTRIISFCLNTYNSGSQACDIFVRYGSTSGTAYGGSTSASAGTPSSSSLNAQMQFSTNARHSNKTLVFVVPKGTSAYVRAKATTSLNFNCAYTEIDIT